MSVDRRSAEKVEVSVPAEHAPVAIGFVWLALREALRMMAERHGNDGWREELYERCQSLFDDVEEISACDKSRFSERRIEASQKPLKSASQLLDAAFDTIVFER